MDETITIFDQYGRPAERSDAVINQRELFKLFLSNPDFAGSRVMNPMRQLSWCYSCIVQTVSAFEQIDGGMWRRQPGRGRGEAEILDQAGTSDKIRALLRRIREPIPGRMTGREWRGKYLTYMLTGGNAWCYLDDPGVDGIPRKLPLFSRREVKPIRDPHPYGPIVGWQIQVDPSIEPAQIPLDRMIHWKMPSEFPDMGMAPHETLMFRMNSDLAQQQFEQSFYENAAMPSSVMLYKRGHLDEKQKQVIRENIEHMHSGTKKAGRILILEAMDWDFKQWSMEQTKTQFFESRRFTREEIASAYSFPVLLLNANEALSGLSRAGQEVARLQLYENAVGPQVSRFEDPFNVFFIEKIDPGLRYRLSIERVPVLMMTYMNTQSENAKRFIEAGYPPNMVSQMLDLPMDPIDGGDVGYKPDNYAPLPLLAGREELHEGEEDEEPEDTDEDEEDGDEDGSDDRTLRVVRVLSRRSREKLKRVLYGIRKDRLGGRKQDHSREWAKLFLPIVAASYQLGYEETLKSAGRIERSYFDDLSPAEIDAQIQGLQENAGDIRFPTREMQEACRIHVAGVLEFLSEVSTRATGRDLIGLDRVARKYADRLVTSAVRHGRLAGPRYGSRARGQNSVGVSRSMVDGRR
jgi:HK97 family phage portal protein